MKKMKRIVFLACLFLSLFLIVANQTNANPEELKVSKVTIYNDGAEIHSKATVSLESGRNEITFKRLSPHIDPATIQIAGQGFRVLSIARGVDIVKNDEAYNDSVRFFQRQMDVLETEIREKSTLMSILEKEERILTANQRITGEGVQQPVDVRNTLEYMFGKVNQIERRRFETSEEIKELRQKVNELRAAVNKLKKPDEEIFSTVTFVLQSGQRARVPVEVRYWVNQAGWFPSYDIFSRDGRVEISYNANIRQQTGTDWKSVQLIVSSASPYKSQQAPRLYPYRLNFGQRTTPLASFDNIERAHDRGIYSVRGKVIDAEEGVELPGVTVIVKGTTVGTVTDVNGEFNLQLPSDARVLTFSFIGMRTQEVAIDRNHMNIALESDIVALQEVVVTGYGVQGRTPGVSVRGMSSTPAREVPAPRPQAPPVVSLGYQTSFSYEMDIPYDIPSADEPSQVEINRINIPAAMRYRAVPAIEEAAFLTARIADWEQYNLLDGEANLYLDNQFMGRSVLETRFLDDTLTLSLGRDESIIIKRKRQREYEQRRTWTNRVREERMWHTAVRNTKKEKIMLELMDQVPVSQTSDIKVEILDISGAKIDDETGILTWNLEINPGETREVIVHYSVEYPRNRTVILD
jgi:hypothetical protein